MDREEIRNHWDALAQDDIATAAERWKWVAESSDEMDRMIWKESALFWEAQHIRNKLIAETYN